MQNFPSLVYFILFLILIELTIFSLFSWFKKDFKWLINKRDENPIFTKKKFKKFFKESYDKDLGWDRKPLNFGEEISEEKTFFIIDKFGSRKTANFKSQKISVFGDSFAFCRYVNDNQTWEYILSKKLKTNILNFGVGNYGLDQAFLKYLKIHKKFKCKNVIFCVVPETIARIFSYWKHFREFNNIFAIKPIINFKKKKISLIKPDISISNIDNEHCVFKDKTISKFKQNDIFYEKIFKKKMFYFPYSFSFMKNFNENIKIFFYLSLHKFYKMLNYNKNIYFDNAISVILKRNISDSHKFYFDKNYIFKLQKLFTKMDTHFKKEKINYKILFVPQYLDIKLYQTNIFYINFFKKIKNPNIIDLTNDFIKCNKWEKFYQKDKYGGHLNTFGNKYLADLIFKKKYFN